MAQVNQLSLSARPKTLDGLVGQVKLVKAIRGHAASGRVVKAWLLCGPKGTGKTTTARILALSYQCPHQKVFGAPCADCRLKRSSFQIYEINAADITGIDKLRESLDGAFWGAMGDGKYRVYIIDECHRLSHNAQDLLLKYVEDACDKTNTVFILCSTVAYKIVETLRSRCVTYELEELGSDDILVLVKNLLKKAESKLPADRLADALIEQGVHNPRLIAHAVEKYTSGQSPEDAVKVDAAATVDVYALCRSVIKGDWPGVAKFLSNVQDVHSVRVGVLAYLRSILLESPEIAVRTDTVARGISALCSIQHADDLVISASLAAELYRVTALFSKYKR